VPVVKLVTTNLCDPEEASKLEPALVILDPSPTKLVAVATPATNISLPAKVTPVPTLEAKLANLLASVIAIMSNLFAYL
jgi:hypothetical protein